MILQREESNIKKVISSSVYVTPPVCIWQSFLKCACTSGNCCYMLFSFGCCLNFSTTLGIVRTGGSKKVKVELAFLWHFFKKKIYGCIKNEEIHWTSERRVVGKWDRQQETHCWKPDRMEKRAQGREGMNWDGTVPIFHATPTPPPFLLNTEKFTFFPHKSAWTVCFHRQILHWRTRVPVSV